MELDEYQKMFELEDRYWWFCGRRHLIDRLLTDHADENPRILDAGCGTGASLDLLETRGEAFGVDGSDVALTFCRQRGKPRLLQSELTELAAGPGSFDVITMLDVLEHIPEDDKALSELFRVLRPGGRLLLTVPAYPFLWSEHDVALHHQRRYRHRELLEKIEGAGFVVRRSSSLVSTFLPIIVAFRLVQKVFPARKGPRTSFVELPELPNLLLTSLLKLEVEVSRYLPLPFGSTIYVVAERPATVAVEVPRESPALFQPLAGEV